MKASEISKFILSKGVVKMFFGIAVANLCEKNEKFKYELFELIKKHFSENEREADKKANS